MEQCNIDCWEVYESYDRDTTHVAYFSSETLAQQFINGHKNRNYFGKNRYKKTFLIFDSLVEVEDYSRANLRRSALAKLTDLERDALGIKD